MSNRNFNDKRVQGQVTESPREIKRQEKGDEKKQLSHVIGIASCLDAAGSLCSNAENSHHGQHSSHVKGKMVGVDDFP
jgi:hypothetical protein